ncbi:unnamed protein product, partial [Didymodactylos carnosus]
MVSHAKSSRCPRNFLIHHAPQFDVKFGDGKSNRIRHSAEWQGSEHKRIDGIIPHASVQYDVEHYDKILNIDLDETITSVECGSETSQSLLCQFSNKQDLDKFERSLIIDSTKLVGHCNNKQMFYRLVKDYETDLTRKTLKIYTRSLSLTDLFKNANVKFETNAVKIMASDLKTDEVASSPTTTTTTTSTVLRRKRFFLSSIVDAIEDVVTVAVAVVQTVVRTVAQAALDALGLSNIDINQQETFG